VLRWDEASGAEGGVMGERLDDFDKELAELYSSVEAELLDKGDRSRRKRLADANKNLDLRRTTCLGSIAGILGMLSPRDVRRFEMLVGKYILLHAANTRAGRALALVADAEGVDPCQALARCISKAGRQFLKEDK
jgi:hypothetical protein